MYKQRGHVVLYYYLLCINLITMFVRYIRFKVQRIQIKTFNLYILCLGWVINPGRPDCYILFQVFVIS